MRRARKRFTAFVVVLGVLTVGALSWSVAADPVLVAASD
jgi:hypothetical protein